MRGISTDCGEQRKASPKRLRALGPPGSRLLATRLVNRLYPQPAEGRLSYAGAELELADDAAAEADGDGMGARARL